MVCVWWGGSMLLRAVLALAAAVGVYAVPALGSLAAPAAAQEQPAAAEQLGVNPGVADARAAWEQARAAVDAAEARREEAAAALAVARQDEAEAAEVLDAETALLVDAERDLDAAIAVLAAAETATAEADAGLRRAVVAYQHALEAAAHSRADLGVAAVSAYTGSDPKLQALGSVTHALDRTSSVTDFLAATERLTYVTVDARTEFDDATAAAVGAADGLRAGEAALTARREEEKAATRTRDEAEAAAEAQQARHAAALAAHEQALAALEQLARASEDADTELTAATQTLAAAATDVQTLGWYAGVPGPYALVWPVDGRPGSGFGPRMHPIHGEVRRHLGVDIAAPTGRPVVAAAAGTVTHAGPRGGYGITVVIDHGDGRSTLYAHLSAIAVRPGQLVEEAERIGAVGSTGQSTGPHLHFEVREYGTPQDPMGYFR